MADIWDFVQHFQIDRARENAIDAKYTAESAKLRITALENRVEALALACQAMWEIIASRQDMDTQMLAEKMEEIDRRDGVPDGKSTQDFHTCSKCQHKLSLRHAYCFYCGAPLPRGMPFHSHAR